MDWSDEMLMAYVDGELDQETMQRLDALLPGRPGLAARVNWHRQLRADFARTYGPIADEPVPAHLQALLAEPRAEVIDFAARAKAKSAAPAKRSFAAQWLPLAAALAVGVLVSQTYLGNFADTATKPADTTLVQGALATALNTQLASLQSDSAIRIGLSFKDKDGAYCRSFTSVDAYAGIACKHDDDWRLIMLDATAGKTGSAYRTASSGLTPALAATIEARIAGNPLSAAEEAAAAKAKWR